MDNGDIGIFVHKPSASGALYSGSFDTLLVPWPPTRGFILNPTGYKLSEPKKSAPMRRCVNLRMIGLLYWPFVDIAVPSLQHQPVQQVHNKSAASLGFNSKIVYVSNLHLFYGTAGLILNNIVIRFKYKTNHKLGRYS